MIFLEADLSQIESRIVFLLTGDPELVRLAKLPSYEYDGHSANAALLFHGNDLDAFKALQKSDPALAKKQRHVGKITSHGGQRDMRGAKLSGNILKELDVLISPEKCDSFITTYHTRYPAIRGVYFRDIRRLVMRDKMLVNSWGRRIDFRYDRLDDELFRQAYSWPPQSENADCLSQHGVYPLWLYMTSAFGYPPNVQVHDSLLASLEPMHTYDVAKFLEKSLARPLLIGGTVFRPFVEFKLGINWGANEKLREGVEFKRLPSRKEWEEHAFALEAERVRRLRGA